MNLHAVVANSFQFIVEKWDNSRAAMLLLFVLPTSLLAQSPKASLNLYGHVRYDLNAVNSGKPTNSFQLGEQDFFVTSQLTKRISFIGETLIEYNAESPTEFLTDLERARLKYDYYKNHSFIVGKFYTPLNYWNDTYHHGRLFFPTIDRPLFVDYYMPAHSLGAGFRGQNLGKWNFGYDFTVTNGIAASAVSDDNNSKALSASFHIKPKEGMRLGISYYNDYLSASHSHTHAHSNTEVINDYDGAINFELYCLSAAYFGKRLELLSESAYNRTKTDSLGLANNYSSFLYTGWRLKESYVPYIIVDIVDIDNHELHTIPINVSKIAFGFKWDFSYLCNLKIQVERNERGNIGMFNSNNFTTYDVKVQLAYGF